MISQKTIENIGKSSAIRAMFEEGMKLKKIYGNDKVFDFSLGNPDPEPPAIVKQTIMNLMEQNIQGLHGYMTNAGYEDVRARIATHLNKISGSDYTSKNIVMTNGAAGALNVVFKTILNPGEEVIIFAPYFVDYGTYVDNYSGIPVILPPNTQTFEPNLEALETSITKKTKAIIINTPNNPTGVVYSESILKQMADILDKKEKELGITIYVISDEPYRELVYDDVTVPHVGRIFKNAITANSFSKSLSLPGERIGYIAANNSIEDLGQLIDGFVLSTRALGFVNAPALFQRVIAESLEAKVDISIYKERRDILYDHLTKIGFECIKPEGAFYLFPKALIADDVAFKNSALKYNLVLVPGKGFGCPGYFRIAYCVGIDTIKNSLPAFTALAKEYLG